MITSNLVFSQWDKIFKDPMTTMAAVDRLVHHSTIIDFTEEPPVVVRLGKGPLHGWLED